MFQSFSKLQKTVAFLDSVIASGWYLNDFSDFSITKYFHIFQ